MNILSLRLSRRLVDQDPENALWLFFNWLAIAFLIFAVTHLMSHALHDLIAYWDLPNLALVQRIFGGFDTVIYVVIATITLFFHRIQRLYRRMEADHHHLEETSHEILALNREMEALVMERTMSEMALGMAHGIRNPLHVIGGFSHRLLRKTDEDDPSRAWATAIAEEARRIEQMVERFETLAQRKTSFFAQEDLNAIVRSTLDLLLPELRAKNLTLVAEICPEPLVGRFNKHLLKVALAHLVRNAVEATPRGGPCWCAPPWSHNLRCWSSRIPAGGCPRKWWRRSSCRFIPPRSAAPAWGWCSCARSWTSTGGSSPWRARWAGAPP